MQLFKTFSSKGFDEQLLIKFREHKKVHCSPKFLLKNSLKFFVVGLKTTLVFIFCFPWSFKTVSDKISRTLSIITVPSECCL